jgi:hypothetical protein
MSIKGSRAAVFTLHSESSYVVVPFTLNIVDTYQFNLSVTARAPCESPITRDTTYGVDGVTMSLYEPVLNVTYNTVTDNTGLATFINIVSGVYRILATKSGFGSYMSTVTLEDTQSLDISLTKNGNALPQI